MDDNLTTEDALVILGAYARSVHTLEGRAAAKLVEGYSRLLRLWAEQTASASYLAGKLAEVDRERLAMRDACNGFVWLGKNLHNIKESPDRFREYFEAALRDALAALGEG